MCAVAMSPGGNFCATASYDGTVILWDANAGLCLGHLLHARSLLPYSDEDARPLADMFRRNFMSGYCADGVFIKFLSFSSDETRLLATFSDGTCYLWEIGAQRWPLCNGFYKEVESCIDSL